MTNQNQPKFSVIIPARNEADIIREAVLAAKNQDVNSCEVIVVDNGSSDKTAEIAKEAGAKVVFEKTEGTNFARQKGFEESKGKIVAFSDADCVPSSDWLSRIDKILHQTGAAAVSGPYDLGFKNPFIKAIDWLLWVVILPRLDKILPFLFGRKAGVIIGGNFAAPRETIEKIGGLPLLKFWGDDTATAMLISRRVGKVVFDPALRIKSSPRRYLTHGLFRVEGRYFWTYFKYYFSDYDQKK
ncbi:glycosyltransferase family 2 protein [Patescibacteria group bacterium]|nr:glycosyltransferase family 2 protein [Patescibacteria group bacterium]MCL5733211.1 glycosyltransferase family 2 protein [Patescibacteria group bacterium]